ncbi:uncharacterized protein LOC123538138 [Mercenaria mercenaria]|uniref:uncharacterized protein LOC123538138 n=1 Tax=Mercenaria mercenaria TaxID=6596 RepID=UPI00234F294D|nr:uncharacterized protein LOC123538138 [Mercenaria mercenaria]
MGLFRGKIVKGLKFAKTKRSTYLLKRKPCVLTPGSTPFSKRLKSSDSTTATPSSSASKKVKLKRLVSPMKSSKKKILFTTIDPVPDMTTTSYIEPAGSHSFFKMPDEILRDLGCSNISLMNEDVDKSNDNEEGYDDDDDYDDDFKGGDSEDQSSSLDFQNTEIMTLLPGVIKEFEINGKLNVLEQFFRLVKEKKFPMRNIAFLLWCDVVRWFENSDTRQMRYSPECLQFFWVGKKLFGGRFVRFMSGMKSETQLLKGSHMFDPQNASVNFACPSESILSSVNPLGDELPTFYKPGLMEPMIKFKAQKDDKNNSYVLMLDGKKIKRGTDVDLLGFETDKTLKEREDERDRQLKVLDKSIIAITSAQEKTNEIQETPKEMKSSILTHLIGLLLLFSEVLRGLRKLRFKKQHSLSKLKDLGGDEWRKSKYAYAIDTCITTLWRIGNVIDKAMNVQRCICKAGACINKTAHLFAQTDMIDLNCQANLRILKSPDKLPAGTVVKNTSIIKQRSDLWFAERKEMKVTGSSIFQAIGCDSLKRQEEHFEKVINGVDPPEPSETQQKAMQHGTDCENHQVATMCGMIMPFLYPDLIFQEEGYYVKDNILVSPDGSLRSMDNSVKYAFEGKAPVEKTFTTTLHDQVPDRYITQTLFEQKALQADGTLYISWTDYSCTLFKVIPNENLCDKIQEEIHDLYYTEKPKRMTRLSNRSKEIKNDLSKAAEHCIFLGEFPSIKGSIKEETIGSEFDDDSPYLKHTVAKGRNISSCTYDELQRHLLLGQEVIKDAYEVQRVMASQVVVYLLADLDRFWKNEQPHAIPVLYFYRGYSLSMDITRKITETCKTACRSNGLDVIVSAADGEFTPLIVRGRDGNPLTQHQLAKDVWKETGKMTKLDMIKDFLNETKEVKTTVEFVTSGDYSHEQHQLRVVSSATGALTKIRTPRKGWTQPKDTNKKVKDVNVINTIEEEEVIADLNNDEENDQIEIQEEIQTLPDTNENNEVSQNETEINNTDNTQEEIPDKIIDFVDISSALSSLNYQKWSNIASDVLGQYFQSADTLKRFTVKELIEVTKCINSKQIDKSRLLKTSNLKKHDLVNQLSELIADGSKIPEKISQRKRNVPSLKKIAQRVIMKRSYPKRVLNVAYSNFIWPEKLRQWTVNARVSNAVKIYGIDEDFYPYYVPDKSEQGDFEIFVYDKTHLGSNLRKAICLDRVYGVSKKAWQSVSEVRPDILNPTLLEVTEEGKIIDQMKERLARNMLSKNVEEQMRENGDIQEANFCEVVREGLYSADDTPGIPAVDRCKKRLALIE